MDKSKLSQVIAKVSDASASIQKCQRRRCSTTAKAANEQREQVRAKTGKLLQQVVDNKISKNEFATRIKKLQTDILESKATADHLQCSLDKCRDSTLALLDAYTETYKYDCRVEKKKDACANLKKAKAILRKKNATVEDYISIVSMIAK